MVILLILFILVCNIGAELPTVPGFASLDAKTGAGGDSPLLTPAFSTDSSVILFEAGTSLYYDAPFAGKDQIYSAHCGALFRHKKHRWAGYIMNFSAFEIYQKTTCAIGWGMSPISLLHVDLSTAATFLTLGPESRKEAQVASSLVLGKKRFSGGFQYQLRQISPNENDLWIHSTLLVLRARNNQLGSQGCSLEWDSNTEHLRIEVSEIFSFTPWLSVGVSVKTMPFMMHFGFIIAHARIRNAVVFGRHPVLGWNKHVALQYRHPNH